MKNILMLAASACAVCAFGAETYYVSTNGPHEVKGVVWGTYVTDDGVAHDAYTDLQQAINATQKKAATIWVEDGFVCETGGETTDGTGSRITTEYGPAVDSLIIRSRSGRWETGAEIRGRYHSAEEPCGAKSIRCVAPNFGAKFIGFRFVGGSTTGNGGGIYSGMYGQTYENCLVENCVAKGSGGGFYKDASRNYSDGLSARMINCVVRNNRALGGDGGGACGVHMISCQVYGNSCFGSAWNNGNGGGLTHTGVSLQEYTIIVSNCVFYGNSASNLNYVDAATKHAGCGGGLNLNNFYGKVYGCVFSNNTATARGGGLYVSSSVRTYNSLVVGNTAARKCGGGIFGGVHTGALVARNTAASAGGVSAPDSAGAHAQLVNCTVTDNTITGNAAPYEAEYVALTNSVVWSDRAGTIPVAANVRASSHSCWPTAVGGTEDCNTDQNPKLWTRDGTTYKAYAATSVSCRGQGAEFGWMIDPSDTCSRDWYGDPRILGDGPDMGWVSLEAKTGVICLSTAFGPTMAMVGSIFSLTTTVENARSDAVYDYHWVLTDLEGNERHFVSDAPIVDLAIVNPGDYEIILFVSNRADAADNDFCVPTSRLLALPLTNYVTSAAGAKPVRPYARPETAATSIHDAVELTVPGSTVFLDAGMHKIDSAISLSKNITIQGAGREATVLRGHAGSDNNYRLFTLDSPEATVRDMTLSGGYMYESGSCVYVNAKGGRLVNCAIVGNTLQTSTRYGGALCMNSLDALADRCVIACNTNSATGYNWGYTRGVVLIQAGTLRNSIVRKNVIKQHSQCNNSNSGGIVYLKGKDALVENCTIVENVDNGGSGCAVWLHGAYQDTPHLYNTILTGNKTPNVTIPESSPLPNLRATDASYCYDVKNCFFVGSAAFDAKSYVGTDAKFVDAAAGDYRLRIDSPCRSKGRNGDWMADALDVYGQPRLMGRKVDIGAAETESGLMLMIR